MSWFKKADFSQIPFADPTEGWDDQYSRKHPDYPEKKRKRNTLQDSPGLGSDTHNKDEESGNGRNLNQIDSLTSGYQVENELYDGNVMEETPTGATLPRTDFQGDSGDSPTVMGSEDEGAGAFLLRYNPDESNVNERKIKNFLQFQNRSHKKRQFNAQDINLIGE